ncbi:alpha-ketoglutarate-dependent dioxygenase AlkB [Corynebacterium sp. H130]|uniref:alpha-ketoglutarate-dependent dioxygenase AlkB n=1 Tax=Corynebacterium sp. H130 TaxID=3133444 RepID=UPI0030AEF619
MSVFMQSLGRSTFGPSAAPMPQWAIDLGCCGLREAVRVAPELKRDFCPQMLLINFYPPGATMGMHQDAGEQSSAPIVSISIGDSAVFRLGNAENRNRPWRDVQLHSGDLLVFGGDHRRAYHGVPKVLDGTLPEGCGLARGRLNLTIRQVTGP